MEEKRGQGVEIWYTRGMSDTNKLQMMPDEQAQFAQAFRKVVDEMAADRPKYIADFLGRWNNAVASLNAASEAIANNPRVVLPEDTWKTYLAPYEAIWLVVYARLMDHLDLDEEDRFLAVADALNQAWKKFFSSVLARHPDAKDLVERLEAARQSAHDAVVPLFTGEADPVLTPVWAKGYKTLMEGYGELKKEIEK